MKQSNLLRPLLGGALLIILAVPVTAQPGNRGPRNGDGPPPRDGNRPQRGPRDGNGPRAKGELNRIWHDIADLEESKLALSKAQAAQVVTLVLPVSKKKTLSDADAKTLADKIEAVLTDAQRAELERGRPRGGRGPRDGGPPPPRRDGGRPDGPPPPPPHDGEGRGPRPDGPPRMNREEFEKVRPFMDALNPFYPPTGAANFKSLPTEFAKDVVKRYSERRTLLETLSKRAKSK